MAIFFKPIAYNEGDFRAFKFVTDAATREGTFMYISGFDVSTQKVRIKTGNGTAQATINALDVQKAKKYFPVFRENVDDLAAGLAGTINTNDFCVGFFGQEFQVHKSVTESGYASTFAQGNFVTVGTNGKLTKHTGKNDTKYLVGYVVATLNATWIHIRTLGY